MGLFWIRQRTIDRRTSGFTLVELLATLLIASILAAIAYISLQSQRDKAEYAVAYQMMGGVISGIEEYRLNEGRYPGDRLPNQKPEGLSEWLPTDPEQIPFGSSFDWDFWAIGSGNAADGNLCVARITFFGSDGRRNSPVYRLEIRGDDRAIDLRVFDCAAEAGAID